MFIRIFIYFGILLFRPFIHPSISYNSLVKHIGLFPMCKISPHVFSMHIKKSILLLPSIEISPYFLFKVKYCLQKATDAFDLFNENMILLLVAEKVINIYQRFYKIQLMYLHEMVKKHQYKGNNRTNSME